MLVPVSERCPGPGGAAGLCGAGIHSTHRAELCCSARHGALGMAARPGGGNKGTGGGSAGRGRLGKTFLTAGLGLRVPPLISAAKALPTNVAFLLLAGICQRLYLRKSVIKRIITVLRVSEPKIVFSFSNIH